LTMDGCKSRPVMISMVSARSTKRLREPSLHPPPPSGMKPSERKASEKVSAAQRRRADPRSLLAEEASRRRNQMASDAPMVGRAPQDIMLTVPNRRTVPCRGTFGPITSNCGDGPPPKFDLRPRPPWKRGSAEFWTSTRDKQIAGTGCGLIAGPRARNGLGLALFPRIRTASAGYTEVCPPFYRERAALNRRGPLPKFAADHVIFEELRLSLTPDSRESN